MINNRTADLVLSGSHLLPSWRQEDLLADGAVAISGDTIVAVGERTRLCADYPDARHMHEPHGLIMPGLINTHTHAAMSCLRGLADDLPLMSWLQDHIFPVEAHLDEELVYWASLLSMAEMIKSGTTACNDMYLFSKAVARAAEHSAMRCWLGEVLYDFPSPCYGELANGFTYVAELLAAYQDHPLITVTINPHGVYTCSPDLLNRCAELAEQHDALLHIHLSETDSEVATCRERYGVSPVHHLEALGVLSSRVVAAHCVKLAEADMELLAEHDVRVSHCVQSNLKLASGIAPIPALIERGVSVSLGSDGSASNNDVDLFAEMTSVAQTHKAILNDPTVMDASTVLHAATQAGADALGAGGSLGTLEPGKKADLIVINLDQPHLTPLYNMASQLVYAVRGADVIHSVIGGRLVMRDRHLLTIDEPEVLARMRGSTARVQALRDASRRH
jgi:5-methylthioadenosine/S-adenosylhomocysteine deaminase